VADDIAAHPLRTLSASQALSLLYQVGTPDALQAIGEFVAATSIGYFRPTMESCCALVQRDLMIWDCRDRIFVVTKRGRYIAQRLLEELGVRAA
jgi:hypothetical protein